MTKRAESKFNVCKKLSKSYNNVWGLPKGDFFRSVRNEREKKKKVSVHGKLLGVKQSLRYFYCNMQEQAFKRALKKISQISFNHLGQVRESFGKSFGRRVV